MGLASFTNSSIQAECNYALKYAIYVVHTKHDTTLYRLQSLNVWKWHFWVFPCKNFQFFIHVHIFQFSMFHANCSVIVYVFNAVYTENTQFSSLEMQMKCKFKMWKLCLFFFSAIFAFSLSILQQFFFFFIFKLKMQFVLSLWSTYTQIHIFRLVRLRLYWFLDMHCIFHSVYILIFEAIEKCYYGICAKSCLAQQAQ